MNRSRLNPIAAVLFLIILLAPSQTGKANSAEPPTDFWFEIETKDGSAVIIESFQIIRCESESCSDPILLNQFGKCNYSECIQEPPILNGPYEALDCVGEICRYSGYSWIHEGDYYKFSIQSKYRPFISNTIKIPKSYSTSWKLILNNNTLELISHPELERKMDSTFQKDYFTALLFTILVELFTVYIYSIFKNGFNQKPYVWISQIILFNLGTLPVVWTFFPALGHFQPISTLFLGFFILGIFIYYSIILFICSSLDRLWSKILCFLVGFPVPIGFIPFCGIFFAFMVGPNRYEVMAPGLSTIFILVLAELFAFGSEAILLYITSHGQLTKQEAIEMSLIMNFSSWILGVIIFGF